MEDRRTAIAIFLCIMVVMIYSELVLQPYYTQQAEQIRSNQTVQSQNSQAVVPPPPGESPAASLAPIVSAPPVAQGAAPSSVALLSPPPNFKQIAGAGILQIESELYQTEISLLGGRITSMRLGGFKEQLGSQDGHQLVHGADGLVLPLAVYSGSASDEGVQYQLRDVSSAAIRQGDHFLVGRGQELAFTLSGKLADGREIKKSFKFNGDSYLSELNVSLAAASADNSRLWLEWTNFLPWDHSTSRYQVEGFTALGTNNKVTNLHTPELVSELESSGANVKEFGSNQWLAYADHYFMANLIPAYVGENSRVGRLRIDAQEGVRKAGDQFFMRAAGESAYGNFKLYLGPKDDRVLAKLDYQLHRSIDLGFFSFLGYPLLRGIRLLHQLFGNYGLAIILLTLAIKFAFLPLTAASFRSMNAMQELQPEIKALRDRVKDPSQLNQEMAALFKRRGVNPMGGCLPMLLQIPVFFGLYNALSVSIELRHAPFALWIKDLSAPEYLRVLGVGIPVMVLLMGMSMWLQQRSAPKPADPVQAKVLSYMPIIFTVMFVVAAVPAGLALYMLVNNLISITQQHYLRATHKTSPLLATLVASISIFMVGFVLTLL